MAGPFALAAVTAVLKDLLNDGMADHDLSPVGNVLVTALPPDRIPVTAADERSQINVFLYQAAPNAALRNLALPSRGSDGARLSNPPLALDLRYLVSAYGKEELHADALLGFAMQVLHENPVLTGAMINATLKPNLPPGVTLPPGLSMLSTSDLGDQIEAIKIVPAPLDTEEMARLWSAMQAKYRPTAVYLVSVVLIEADRAAKAPLPVLQQGDTGRGPTSRSDLFAPFPTIVSIALPDGRSEALLGDKVVVAGHDLAGETGQPAAVQLVAVLSNLRTGIEHRITVAPADRTAASVEFLLPNQPSGLPAGVYTLALEVAPLADPADARTTNLVALPVAPQITSGLGNVARVNVDPNTQLGDATLAIGCAPEVLPGQKASLVLGTRSIPAEPHPAATATLTFKAQDFAAGEYRVRLRIDGIESLLVDRSNPDAPAFDPSQLIKLT